MVMRFLFPERKSAIRIVEKVCADIKSPEATEAIELIVFGVKNNPGRRHLPTDDLAIITATGLWKNPSAVRQFLKMVPVTDEAAVKFLREIGRAGLQYAQETGIAEKSKNVPSVQQAIVDLDEKYD